MRITELDKRRAIKRLPEFKKDHTQYKKIKDYDSKMRKKIELEKKWGYEIEKIIYADRVAERRHDAPTVEAVTRITDDPYVLLYEDEGETPSLLSGKSLYLKVTLEGKTREEDKTEYQLIDDFKEAIKPYKDLLEAEIPEGAKKKRNRKTDITEGIWKVYDLYLKAEKNKVETARQWFKVSGNPAPLPNDDEFDEKLLKQIKTAITNAEKIIAAVRKECGLK